MGILPLHRWLMGFHGRWIALSLLIVGFLGSVSAATESDIGDIKVVIAARATAAPKIDGRFDDEAWRGLVWAEDFLRFKKGDVPTAKTRFAIGYDDHRLYLAVSCEEPVAILASDGHDRDSYDMFRDDNIEVFLDPRHDHLHYMHFAFNAAGIAFDERGTDPSWDATSRFAVVSVPGGWNLEFAVLWSDLGIDPAPGTVIGLNLCRNRTTSGELSQWASTSSGYHEPPRFGHAVLTDSIGGIVGAEEALRMGGRLGQIRMSGPVSLIEASAPAFSEGTLVRFERAIADLQATAIGTAESARLGALLASARRDAAALRRACAPGGKEDERFAAELNAIRRLGALEGDAWQARLDDLVERISRQTDSP